MSTAPMIAAAKFIVAGTITAAGYFESAYDAGLYAEASPC